MMNKKQFTLATTLLTLSANIFALTLWQLPSNAQPIITKQNKRSLSLKNQQKPQFIPNPILETNLDTSSVNKPVLNNLNSGDFSQSEINFSTAAPIQIAHHRNYSGRASWYGPGFHGRRTANGEIFNSNALTAAHRSLPFGTRVRVTNIRNGRSVIVRINDRGPFIRGRIIDISAGAARRLNMISSGVAPVRLEILGR